MMQAGQARNNAARPRRLVALADMLPETDTLADIGTDHGRLLISLIQAGRIRKGIGVEIVQGPYLRAKENIAAHGLTDQIEIRLGDGLTPLAPGEATACAIAGLGGRTITDILGKGKDRIAGFSWLLLQPMTGAKNVRLYLQQNGWMIHQEALVEERAVIYQIILAQKGAMAPLSDREAELGPLLLAEKPPLLEAVIRQKITRLKSAAAQLELSVQEASQEKKARFHKQIGDWEALL